MLACTDNRDKSSLRKISGDKVMFMNVHKRYKFPTTVTVEYILSPKVKPSSHDYIGIYPRDWKDLREFVGFEHPIAAPFEEDNLYRIIQFTCQPPHVTASLNQDYHFVYVDQSQQVLGRSNYFQFGDDDWQEGNAPEWWSKNENDWQDDSVTSQSVENPNIQLSHYEIAYNECFFRNQDTRNDQINAHHGSADVCPGGLDEATNAYVSQQEPPKACYIPENVSCQRFAQNAYSDHKPRRRRAVVKTTQVYPNAHRDIPSTSFTKAKDQVSNTSVDLTYSQNWLQSKHHVPMQNRAFSVRGDTNSGAIPKKCPKCQAPSDYNNKQQIMQHELSQAYEQIRDLRTELDQLRRNFELSVTAHAKIRATAELAKFSGDKNFYLLRNLIQSSLVAQYGGKLGNPAAPVVFAPSAPEPSGWIIPGSQSYRPINYGRAPSEERRLRGREKELKAYIGCQEKTIQTLVLKLLEARKLVEDTKLVKCNDVNTISTEDTCFTQKSLQGIDCKETTANAVNAPRQGVRIATKVLQNENDSACSTSDERQSDRGVSSYAKVNASGSSLMSLKSLDQGKALMTPQEYQLPWEDSLVVEPKYFHMNPSQLWDCKVIVNEDQTSLISEKGSADSLREANNNNFETKNLNSVDMEKTSKCTDSEPTLTDTNDVTCEHH